MFRQAAASFYLAACLSARHPFLEAQAWLTRSTGQKVVPRPGRTRTLILTVVGFGSKFSSLGLSRLQGETKNR